jgi:predicted hotdog family 3-hydroxylacyl-ACP dehydratase
MLAAARNVVLGVQRLDDIEDDLIVSARRLLAEEGRLLYEFALHAGGRELLRGRAAVVLGEAMS